MDSILVATDFSGLSCESFSWATLLAKEFKIIEAAKEKDADLIVMATHGRTGLSHALMGSVAEKVVRQAPCPVLTIRPRG